MNRINRLISILLIFILSLANTVVLAQDSVESNLDMKEYNESFHLLSELSIINDEDGDDISFDKTISRGRFAKLVVDCLTQNVEISDLSLEPIPFSDVAEDYKYYNEICYLKSLGILNGDGSGTFRPNDSITYNEALHLMLLTLGYGDYIRYNGGFPIGDYTSMRRASIDYEISNDNTCFTLLPLVVKCLEGIVLEYETFSTNFYTYKNDGDITGLEAMFGVRKGTGILQANSSESISIGTDIEEDKLVIDDITYICDFDSDVYVGTLVEFYYRLSDDDLDEVFIINPSSRCEIFEVLDDDIDGFDNMTYWYRMGERQTQRKIKVTGRETIVYNSKVMTAFDQSLMVPDDGRVVFIDNDNDSDYDVIKIYSYESFVVDSINVNSDGTDFVIYPKSLYGLSPYTTNIDISKLYNNEGKEIGFDRISIGDSLSVYAYLENGRNIIYRAYVSNKKLSGDLNSISIGETRSKLEIDGVVWRVSSSYSTQADRLRADYNYIFYIDFYGNVIGVDGDSINTMAYGYLIKYAEGEFSTNYMPRLKIYSELGNVIIYNCAEKVFVDDVKYTDSNLNELIDRLNDSDGVGNIIRYSVNSNKEINRIDLWENVDYVSSEANTFNRLKLVNPKTELYLKKAYKNFGGNIKYDESTKFFLIPSDTEQIEEEMRIIYSKDLKTDGYYEISSYTSNTDSLIPDVCLLKIVNSKNSGYSQSGIVTGSSMCYVIETDEIHPAITIEDYSKSTELLIKDDNVLKSLPGREIKKGDIINYFINYDGYIDNISLIYRADGDIDNISTTSVEPFTNGARLAIGTAFDTDGKYIKIHFGSLDGGSYPSASSMEVYNIDNFKKIIIVDATSPRIFITNGGINDVSTYVSNYLGDKVILNTEYGDERVLYVIRK